MATNRFKIMKKILLFNILLLVYGGGRVLSQSHNPKYLREKDGTFQQIAKEMTPSGWIIFKDEAKVNAATFFATYATNLGIGQHYEYQLTKDETDNLKIRHQRYQLYYKKTPVDGSEFSLHSRDGILLTAHGRIVEDMDFDLSKPMPEQKALDYALTDKGLSKADFKGQQKPPQGKLVLAQLDEDFSKSSFKIAYAFDVYGTRGSLDVHTVYVDASDGKILKRIPLVLQCFGMICNHTDKKHIETLNDPAPITNNNFLVGSTFTPRFNNTTNRYGGQQNFETENNPNGPGLRLSMNNGANLGALITRRNANNIISSNRENIFNGNGDVINPNTTWGINEQNTTTAHWALQRAFQYFNNNYGRNGTSNDGSIARMIIDANETGNYWTRNSRVISIGFTPSSTSSFDPNLNNSFVALDVIAHEYTHGIVEATAGLSGLGQAASLNEGIADIFSVAIERSVLPNDWNWTLGEDAWTIRNLENPKNVYPPVTPDPQPIRFGHDNDTDWYNSNSFHRNNGVLNRWFYAICTGNRVNGLTMTPISFERATAIVYRALTYLQSSSVYGDMRNATVQAATDLNNGDPCAYEPFAVATAWDDANVNGFTCINSCDFNLTASSFNSNPACGAAFTLNAACSGANCGGVSYTWTGAGGVRNGQQVSYNAPTSNGSYTYNPTASRSGCSNKTASVTVNVTSCGGGSSCSNTGSISYDRWNNIGGGSTIQDLRNNTNNLQNAPTVSQNLSVFQAPSNICDYCGTRIRGYVCPPTSGNYTFWVEGDDNTELMALYYRPTRQRPAHSLS